jgi:hypothetical protein
VHINGSGAGFNHGMIGGLRVGTSVIFALNGALPFSGAVGPGWSLRRQPLGTVPARVVEPRTDGAR